MNYESQQQLCSTLARIAHKFQMRKNSNRPYFCHITDVVNQVMTKTNDTKLVCVAYLHDILEDTEVLNSDLHLMGIDASICYLVNILTKRNGTYDKYIERICEDKEASLVKLCDMNANLQDSPSLKQIVKYLTFYEKVYIAAIGDINYHDDLCIPLTCPVCGNTTDASATIHRSDKRKEIACSYCKLEIYVP
jgi:(p)ppGpp synthase/HD superfamily hydrolase